MTVVIVDYGSGNLRSAAKAFERASGGAEVVVTGDAERAGTRAERIVLPGVGAFGDCAAGLRALPGMVDALEENVIRKGKPFLGICVGMQLMAERGLEHGSHAGLGWIKGEVTAIACDPTSTLKVPHMGWNDLRVTAPDHPLFAGIPSGLARLFRARLSSSCRRTGRRAGRGRLRRRRSSPRSGATTWPAPSSTRRRARRWACG